jgi:hypothetical protein
MTPRQSSIIISGGRDETYHSMMDCCKAFGIVVFGWIAIRIAWLPFEKGTFTPSNPGLEWNSNASTLFRIDSTKQRIVLFVGYHEALQCNDPSSLATLSLLSDAPFGWSYPIPSKEELSTAIQFRKFSTQYCTFFDPLFSALRYDPLHYETAAMNVSAATDIIELYRRKVQEDWSQGKSIIFASRDAAHLVNTKVAHAWNRLLPLGVESDVEVVVPYSTPRIRQLIEIWDVERASDPTMTLKSFLVTTKFEDNLVHVNPLGVASVFVRRGLKTIIVDENGLAREKLDIRTAVSCFILKSSCNSSNILEEGSNSQQESISPSPLMDLSEQKLKQIERVLQDYDCGFYNSLAKPSNVYFLYRDALFRSCSSRNRHYTVKELVKKIQGIATEP